VKLPRFLPRPAAWASAVALFLYAGAVSVAMAAVSPLIAELMQWSPRLGWLAVLATWVAPIFVAAGAHRAGHTLLDFGDTEKRASNTASLWAGFVAWAAILVVSLTTAFVMLVVDPPPIEPDALATLASSIAPSFHAPVRIVVWVVLAAYVYQLERVSSD